MQIDLHIGIQKTASTLIQGFLAQNRANLAKQGILYPATFGRQKTSYLKHFMKDGPKLPAPREELKEKLRQEFSGPFTKAVLSDETIYPCSPNRTKERIRLGFDDYATQWRVLAYVRRPDEHLASQYQQKVRNAGSDFSRHTHGSLDDFLAERMRDHYYRYAMHMERFEEVFGKGSVEVRVFSRKTLRGSPVADFTQWIGADPAGLAPESESKVNEGIDRIGTEILLFLYRYHRLDPERIGGFDMRQVRGRLRDLKSEERVRLTTAQARRLQAHFRKDHERLAERWLKPEEAAVFLAPSAELAPVLPVDPGEVYERMLAVFGDPDFARIGVREITGPASARIAGLPRPRPRALSFLAKARRVVLDRLR